MADPTLKLPIDETTPLLASSATNPLDDASTQSAVPGHGGESGPEDNADGSGRTVSPKVAVAILTIGRFHHVAVERPV